MLSSLVGSVCSIPSNFFNGPRPLIHEAVAPAGSWATYAVGVTTHREDPHPSHVSKVANAVKLTSSPLGFCCVARGASEKRDKGTNEIGREREKKKRFCSEFQVWKKQIGNVPICERVC